MVNHKIGVNLGMIKMKLLKTNQINALINNEGILKNDEEQETLAIIIRLGLNDILNQSVKESERLNRMGNAESNINIINKKIIELEKQRLIVESLIIIRNFLDGDDETVTAGKNQT